LPIPPLDGFGILAPLLNRNLRALLYSFSMFGFLLIFMLFAMNPSIRVFFQTTINNFMTALNVNPLLANQGLSEFMFWRS
jgi:Zn-dependent protease